ncbi:hypothetical protein LTR15_010586 [Elasticomyces elasticus]|nr:hypothetical protein LTR15_010586 [Elasticomyces elasticus]
MTYGFLADVLPAVVYVLQARNVASTSCPSCVAAIAPCREAAQYLPKTVRKFGRRDYVVAHKFLQINTAEYGLQWELKKAAAQAEQVKKLGAEWFGDDEFGKAVVKLVEA